MPRPLSAACGVALALSLLAPLARPALRLAAQAPAAAPPAAAPPSAARAPTVERVDPLYVQAKQTDDVVPLTREPAA